MLSIKTDVIRSGFDKKTCFVHLRGNRTKDGVVVLTTQKLMLMGCDLFGPLHSMKSFDGGQTWTEPTVEPAFVGRQDGGNSLFCCDFTPFFHKKTQKLFGTGHTVRYTDKGTIVLPRKRETCYSVYDDGKGCFGDWQTLTMPDMDYYWNSGAGCTQALEMENGDILLPFYFMAPDKRFFYSAVMQIGFDGAALSVKRISDPVSADEECRGVSEPSVAYAGGSYFMTLRTDTRGYVCASSDAFKTIGELKPWQWKNGEEIGNYNTQQHFVTLNGNLYLVYTRRGANNDHVFRHRAPLFIAQVDTQRLCLIKETEQVLVPQRGARLGNFGVTQLGDNEAWVTVTEWMQPVGCEKYGSDNAFYIARIREE